MANVQIGQLPQASVGQLTDLVEIERPGDVSYGLALSAIVSLVQDELPAVVWGSIIGNLSDQSDLQAALDAKVEEAPINGNQYARQDGAWTVITSAVNWGDIGGTLSNQTDLQAALDGKANQSNTYTKAEVDAAIAAAVANYLPLSGGTVTGVLTVNGNVVGKSDVQAFQP